MKKIIIYATCFFLLTSLCACGQEQKNKEQSTIDYTSENVKADVQDEYYKLRTEPIELDVDKLTEYLLGEDAVYKEQAQIESTDEIYCELTVNDKAYIWSYNSSKSMYGFFYGEAPFNGIPDIEEGMEIANNFIELFQIEFSQNVENNLTLAESEGAIKYTYKQQYKGTDFMGNSHVALGGGGAVDGIWMDVEVDTEGIKMVSCYNLSQVVEEAEAYNAKEDFLNLEQISKKAEAYVKKTLTSTYGESSEIEMNGGVTEISVIYIPSEENGEIYWKPGFQVFCEYTVNGTITTYRLIMDAFDGYVYGSI